MKYSSPCEAEVESLLSRGDHRVADWIFESWKKGDRLTGWSEHFDYNRWEETGKELGMDFDTFVRPSRDFSSPLPWDGIDIHVSKDYLWEEWEKALKETPTASCWEEQCVACGLDAKKCIHRKDRPYRSPPVVSVSTASQEPVQRIRMRYSRLAPLLPISHLEMTNTILRAMRRAGIPLRYSEGFHPQPDVQFAFALPVGYASSSEYMDAVLLRPENPAALQKKLNAVLPEGISVERALSLQPRIASLSSTIGVLEYSLRYSIPGSGVPDWRKILQSAAGDESLYIENISKKGKIQKVWIHPQIYSITIERAGANIMEIRLLERMTRGKNTRPHELISILAGGAGVFSSPLSIQRTGMWIEDQGKCISPFLYPRMDYRRSVWRYA